MSKEVATWKDQWMSSMWLQSSNKYEFTKYGRIRYRSDQKNHKNVAKEGIKYDCDQCEYTAKFSESSQAIKTEGNARRKPFFSQANIPTPPVWGDIRSKDPLVFSMADMLRQCIIWYQNLILTIWMELQKITFGRKCWSINIIDLFFMQFYAVHLNNLDLVLEFGTAWKSTVFACSYRVTYRVQWLQWLQWLQRQLFRFRLRASMTTETAI